MIELKYIHIYWAHYFIILNKISFIFPCFLVQSKATPVNHLISFPHPHSSSFFSCSFYSFQCVRLFLISQSCSNKGKPDVEKLFPFSFHFLMFDFFSFPLWHNLTIISPVNHLDIDTENTDLSVFVFFLYFSIPPFPFLISILRLRISSLHEHLSFRR